VVSESTTAAFVLNAAGDAGFRIGTDGDELLICGPRGMPRDSYFSFQRAILAHKDEIIALILKENNRQ